MFQKEMIRAIAQKTRWGSAVYLGLARIKERLLCRRQLVKPILQYKRREKAPVFLVFTPEHANLGDHAIAYAETQLLQSLAIRFYEITGRQLMRLNGAGYLNVLDGASILINGGGNLGTLWPEIEEMHRAIVHKNPNSTIVIMPNTIYYENTEAGRRAFEQSKKIYNQHKRLHIYARERLSYEVMKDAYSDVKLMPDMVLGLNQVKPGGEREGCLLCMRDDVEKIITEPETEKLRRALQEIFGEKISVSSTVLAYDVPIARREEELEKKFAEFRSAKLVVTDRLHGMIFAAITGTNCMVLDSRSPKLRGCYEWIKDLGYIAFAENPEEVRTVYEKLCQADHRYDQASTEEQFQKLAAELRTLLRQGK